MSPARVERKRRSGSLVSGSATKARQSTPSGPTLPMSGSVTIVTGWDSSNSTRGTISAATSSPGSSPSPIVTTTVRPRAKHAPALLPSTGTIPRESTAGCPELARQASVRSPAAGTRTTADCAPSARRPPAMAAWATSPGVVAAARAELSWCRCWLRSRLTNSVNVRRARSTAWAAAPVMVKRKLRSGSVMSRSSSQWTTTAPMVRSDTTSGTMASARNRSDDSEAEMSGRWRRRSSSDSAKKATFSPSTGPSGSERGQHAVDRLVGVVAEAAERPQLAPLVEQGEGGRVDSELVAQGGEHGVGHLGRVGGRGQGPGHGLHPLGRLGRHAASALVPRLGPRRPQLDVALTAQVGDPHRQCSGRQLGQHAQRVVQLTVTVRGCAEDEGEEGGQEPHHRDPRGAGERGGDEGGDGQEADQRDVPPVDGEHDGHRGDPQERDEGCHGLGTVGAGAPGGGLKLLVSLVGHVVSPRSPAAGSSSKRYSPCGSAMASYPFTGVVPGSLPRRGGARNPRSSPEV